MTWRRRSATVLPPPSLAHAIDVVTQDVASRGERFAGRPYFLGHCPVCGTDTPFFLTADTMLLVREALICPSCNTTSRYRSLALGLLQAIAELTDVRVDDLAALEHTESERSLAVYDTQIPFAYELASYPLPEYLARVPWISVETSRYEPETPWGAPIEPQGTNQTLEALTFADAAFDIVLTCDVMEHVRLIDQAHAEIARVLRPGGRYLFTVPHTRHAERLVRVAVHDPADPTRDEFLLEPEYHGDINGPDNASLSYRVFGTEIDAELEALGLPLEYRFDDVPSAGVIATELFFCRRL